MARPFELSVRLSRPLRSAALARPDEPPPPAPPPPAPSPEDLARAEAERQALASALTALRSAAARLGAREAQLLGEMRRAAVELAVAVAGRLLRDRALAGQLSIEATVREAVDRLPSRATRDRPVCVHLHPDDLAAVRARAAGEELAGLELRADPALARGSCLAEAGEVSVLAELEAQLAELRRYLLEAVADARPATG
jgi:flagellar assembly protein FliH